MAPEQARGEDVDARTDLYAVGVLLFEMLCGRPPFVDRTTARLLTAITSSPPPDPLALNPEVDPLWADVVRRLLAKDPGARPSTAVETARRMGPGHTIVTVLCDSGDRYRSRLYDADWLAGKGLHQPERALAGEG